MKFAIRLLSIVLALLPNANGAELRPFYSIGTANADHTAAWNGHIDHAAWLDEETILYWSNSGVLTCFDLKTRKPLWSIKDLYQIDGWSVSSKHRRAAFEYAKTDERFSEERYVTVIDCTNGKPLFTADQKRLAKLLDLSFVLPTKIALTPDDARLIILDFAFTFGRNAYVLDPSYTKVESTFEIDPFLREISFSADSRRASYIARDDVLCVRDIVKNKDVTFTGERILKEPEGISFSIGGSFLSHVRHDGNNLLIYSIDGGCFGKGKLNVENIETKTKKTFDSRHGHIELDVDFSRKRIAVTGTETDLTVLTFDGEVVADLPKATLQRNLTVAFSPSGKRIAVGSWDNTLRIFTIEE